MKEWKPNHEDGHATQALYEWCETANMGKDKGQTKEVANCSLTSICLLYVLLLVVFIRFKSQMAYVVQRNGKSPQFSLKETECPMISFAEAGNPSPIKLALHTRKHQCVRAYLLDARTFFIRFFVDLRDLSHMSRSCLTFSNIISLLEHC